MKQRAFKLTVASVLCNLNALIVGNLFVINSEGFGSVVALMASVITPVVAVAYLMNEKNKAMVREFLDTKI